MDRELLLELRAFVAHVQDFIRRSDPAYEASVLAKIDAALRVPADPPETDQ